jgi:hypothetical protein
MSSRIRAIDGIVFLGVWMAWMSLAVRADTPPNTLSDEEKQLGWKLLFDGEKIEGWRSYRTNTFPERGWVVENGTLHKQAGERPGDIMTVDTYEDFELFWEWKLIAMGNNGVKYFRGHILLTDHKDPCWYRNLKIRVLP